MIQFLFLKDGEPAFALARWFPDLFWLYHRRAGVLHAKQLELDPWLADPHLRVNPHQPPIREEASLGCVATEDHSFQVVVCCHGNSDVSMLRIICSLMEMVSR